VKVVKCDRCGEICETHESVLIEVKMKTKQYSRELCQWCGEHIDREIHEKPARAAQ